MVTAGACASDAEDPAGSASTSAVTIQTTTTERPTTETSITETSNTETSTTTAGPTISMTLPTSSTTEEVLEGILQSHLDEREFVGARIAIMNSDGTIAEASAGAQTTDPGSAPVEPDVPWGIGSVTKSFVSVVALQLAEEGLLDLDASIIDFLPDLPGADRITPRQLLQHTSGLGEYINDPLVLDDAQREWSPSELIAVAEASGRFGALEGQAYHYSNTNFIVLGEIIEQVTGAGWADAVRTRIVEPLGMTSTAVISADSATGHVLTGELFVDATHRLHPSIGGAAGGLESTNRDLLRFATALVNGTLLSPESQTAMQTFVPGEDYSSFGIVHSYGLGLERYENDGITVFGHLGSGAAHSAFFGFDVDSRTVVAVMMNSSNPGPQAVMAIEALTAISEAS